MVGWRVRSIILHHLTCTSGQCYCIWTRRCVLLTLGGGRLKDPGENRELFELPMLHTTGVSNEDEKPEGKQLKVLDRAVRSKFSHFFDGHANDQAWWRPKSSGSPKFTITTSWTQYTWTPLALMTLAFPDCALLIDHILVYKSYHWSKLVLCSPISERIYKWSWQYMRLSLMKWSMPSHLTQVTVYIVTSYTLSEFWWSHHVARHVFSPSK